MIRVLLVDDHGLVRTGIRRLLEDHGRERGIEVVAEAASGEEALELSRQEPPDVVLMDVNMPGIGGLEATRRLLQHEPSIKVIALTVHARGPVPKRLLEVGATGYLTKGCSVDEMITAIVRVARGERYLCAEIAEQLALSLIPSHGESPLDTLSYRELQILLLITEGHKGQAISQQLHLSPKTVSTYKRRLLEKLGVQSDAELMRLAMKQGLVEDEQVGT